MTVFESIKSQNIDEFVNWIDKNFAFDTAPYMYWFDRKYCRRCHAERAYDADRNKDMEYAWCESSNKCKFFQEMDEVPSAKQIIKMWLESEDNDGIQD